jgi:hypothetical protein
VALIQDRAETFRAGSGDRESASRVAGLEASAIVRKGMVADTRTGEVEPLSPRSALTPTHERRRRAGEGGGFPLDVED